MSITNEAFTKENKQEYVSALYNAGTDRSSMAGEI